MSKLSDSKARINVDVCACCTASKLVRPECVHARVDRSGKVIDRKAEGRHLSASSAHRRPNRLLLTLPPAVDLIPRASSQAQP
jgi:hypothetical protein